MDSVESTAVLLSIQCPMSWLAARANGFHFSVVRMSWSSFTCVLRLVSIARFANQSAIVVFPGLVSEPKDEHRAGQVAILLETCSRVYCAVASRL